MKKILLASVGALAFLTGSAFADINVFHGCVNGASRLVKVTIPGKDAPVLKQRYFGTLDFSDTLSLPTQVGDRYNLTFEIINQSGSITSTECKNLPANADVTIGDYQSTCTCTPSYGK